MFKTKFVYIFLFLCTLLSADNSIFFFENKINKIYYLEDKSDENISKIVNHKNWKLSDNKLNFGYSSNPYWIKFKYIQKDSNSVLVLNDYIYSYIDIYVLKDKKVIKEFNSGIKNSIDKSLINFRKTSVPLDFAKNIEYEVYIKVSSIFYPLNMPIQIVDKETFNDLKAYDTSMIIFFFFVLLLMVLFNVTLYFITKIKYYVQYLIYLITLIATVFYTSSYAHIYLFKDGLTNSSIFLFQTFGLTMFYTLMILICSFLTLNKTSKNIINYSFFTLISMFFINWSLIFISNQNSILLTNFLNILSMIIVIIISLFIIKRILKFDKLSFIITLIWLPLSLGMITFISNQIYLFTSPLVIEYLMKVLFIYETIFISLLLAYNMTTLEQEKNQTEKTLHEKEKLLIRANKLNSMGEMLNNIAHQWKQPLSRINSIVFKSYNLLEDKKSDELKKVLLSIENETSYMSNTISSLLSFFHINKKIESINLEDIAVKQKTFISNINKDIEVDIKILSKDIVVTGYKNEYEQVVNVIVENAIDSLKETSIEKPKITMLISKMNDKTLFSIENNGNCIDDNIIDKIFEPYFSTKSKEKHHGIGLYMSKMLIEESMGKILKVTNLNHGVRFTIEG